MRCARFLVRVYQAAFSSIFGGQCRFEPTCSQYALDALARHGLLRGVAKTALRVAKCHPFHPGGYDPA